MGEGMAIKTEASVPAAIREESRLLGLRFLLRQADPEPSETIFGAVVGNFTGR